MKKGTQIFLAMVIALSLSIITGCSKQGADKYKSDEDFEKNIVGKKEIVVDGKEAEEYTMKDGTTAAGIKMGDEEDSESESE